MTKSAVKANKRPKKPPHPRQRQTPFARSRVLPSLAGAGLIALAGLGVLLMRSSGADTAGAAAAARLPNTSDYHALLIAPDAPDQLVLGTHQGLFRSVDGGRTWVQAELVDRDAMNLARTSSEAVWAAGHNVLARSRDGGSTWEDVQPAGLPSLDVHGFAVDPESDDRLWAAVAGEGLYRSDDDGASFKLVTREVGAGVMGLEVRPGGQILAADMGLQKLLSSEDGGKTWSTPLDRPVMAVVTSPVEPKLLLASTVGNGAGIVRSNDGGQSWVTVLALPDGAGPIAWSESDPATAYVVSLDRTLFRSTDAGSSWRQVTEEAS